jgi:hypothetical protein
VVSLKSTGVLHFRLFLCSGGPACETPPFLTAVYWAASVSAGLGLLPKQEGPFMCVSFPFLFLFE